MKASKQIRELLLLMFGAAAIAGGARAQDPQEPQAPQTPEGPGKPKPAARGVPGLNDSNTAGENDQQSNWQPDNSPVTGLQNPTIGSPELGHSYWVPGLEYGSTIQSRPLGQQATSGWYANNYVGGDLSLVEAWSHSQLALNYSGGGFFTTSNLESNGWYQQLSIADTMTFNRWQVQFFDTFSYLPESDFGFFGESGVALPGIGGSLGPSLPGLAPSILPNQSIYSAIGPRYGNAFAAQVTYQLSRRGSITVGGSYGLLRFTQAGNIDSDMTIGNVGYNYALNKTDSIGVFYQFAGYHYSGEPQAIGSHSVNFVYGKKVTQRIALKLYGGPQFSFYRVPIGTQTESTNGSAGVSLTYAVQRGSINLSYFHGLTGGSGVLLGATTDQVTGGLSHQFALAWTGFVNFGYSRNGSLGSVSGVASPTFDDWFVGGGISRPFGRNVNFTANYSARIEHSNLATCTGPGCSTDYTQNMVTISLQWHTRPFVLR
jgi:hypothetical protein